jgi:hypothetical protein
LLVGFVASPLVSAPGRDCEFVVKPGSGLWLRPTMNGRSSMWRVEILAREASPPIRLDVMGRPLACSALKWCRLRSC